MARNEHIESMGFRLDEVDGQAVGPLLEACDVEPLGAEAPAGWTPSSYLAASTTAGGTAAAVGWTRHDDLLLVHSLAVAPPTRGRGVGASILATALGEVMDASPVAEVWLCTAGAEHFFAGFGFEAVEGADIPEAVGSHPALGQLGAGASAMRRRYHPVKRGLDQCAFRLIHNTTHDATLPPGSVFLFRQSGSIIETFYRGGAVRRGHFVGSIRDAQLTFLWHQARDDGELMAGDGQIFVDELDDGRRELREKLGATDPGELLLREV